MLSESLRAKQDILRDILRAHAPLLIAYSGGVDSAYLLAEARNTLGARGMLGVIADSASLPRKALAAALTLAEGLDAPVEVVATGELQNPDYAKNPLNRCYFCKAELFLQLESLAAKRHFKGLAYGENADDMHQVRPGREAAAEFKVLAPLRDAGLNKEEIRAASRELGLATADAPAQPCLSSRIPHGTPVTPDVLAMVEAAEDWVRSLGFSVFRVRHMANGEAAPQAKVQISPVEMPQLSTVSASLEAGLKAVGYATVEIDKDGYKST
ncbi:MAG: ATP-dependent sacrificial sulfur transferase LarE [Proteobacteria bacterium]|nr:ATP-dependent sacrificial sulfur transferase LarE [Pseudomonadota bacterium]